MLKKILIILGVWKVYVFVLTYLATYVLPLKLTFTPFSQEFGHGMPYFVGITGNFDGYFYMKIAQNGYIPSRLPFFPLYPLFIRLTHDLTHLPYIFSALIISYLAFGLSIFIIYKLFLLDEKHKEGFLLFLMTMLLFPTAYSYTNVYNDSLFLLFATSTLYFGRRKHWTFASITGLFATLTRLNGLALFFYLGIEYLTSTLTKPEQTFKIKKLYDAALAAQKPEKIFQSRIFISIIIPLAYIGYLRYIQLRFGNWRLIYKAMDVWRQNIPTFPLQVVWRYIKIFIYYRPFDMLYLVAVLEFMFVVLYIGTIIYAFKKIRLSYWIFLAASVLIPATTGTFAGMPRYGLHLYPLFLTFAIFLRTQTRPSRMPSSA